MSGIRYFAYGSNLDAEQMNVGIIGRRTEYGRIQIAIKVLDLLARIDFRHDAVEALVQVVL